MQEPNNRKMYIMNEPVSLYSRDAIAKEIEKLVRVGDREVIVVQKLHIPSNKRWITVVGYVLEQMGSKENQAYFVQPITDQKELEAMRQFLEADESLEKKLEILPRWSRFLRM